MINDALNFPRLFRTLRHLRISQIVYRIRNRIFFPFARILLANFHTKSLDYRLIFNPVKDIHSNGSYLGDREFSFLNSNSLIAKDWTPLKPQTLLWVFNLHYFDYLDCCNTEELILDWIRNVTRGSFPAWHPYPTSRRICNWIWFVSKESSTKGLQPREEILNSLRQQVDFLQCFIEKDLLGNHLLANATALVIAGCFFDDSDYVDLGLKIFMTELPEQVLSDGGHYERSPMYHCLVLEDLLAVYLALLDAKRPIQGILTRAISEMTLFLEKILDNGKLPLLNDSSHEIAANPSSLIKLVKDKNLTSNEIVAKEVFQFLSDSGLVIYRSDNLSVTFDVGKIGPDFLPGHAHNDTLGILVSLNGHEILTDSGIYLYQSEFRNYFRSAKAHNVLMLEDVEPNEIWGAFRVGHRGVPEDVCFDRNGLAASASHNCYKKFGVKISRAISIDRHGIFCWEDKVSSQGVRSFVSNLHFAPGVELANQVREGGVRTLRLTKAGKVVANLQIEEGVDFEILSSFYSGRMGVKEDRLNLRFRFDVKGERSFLFRLFA